MYGERPGRHDMTEPASEQPPTEHHLPEGLHTARSLVLVNTGDGKGKSSAAFGVVIRAVARDWKVAVVQFLKSGEWHVGEEDVADAPRRRLVRARRGVHLGLRRPRGRPGRRPRRVGAGQGAHPGRRVPPRRARRDHVPDDLGMDRHRRRRRHDPRASGDGEHRRDRPRRARRARSTSPTPSPRCARSSTPTTPASRPRRASTTDGLRWAARAWSTPESGSPELPSHSQAHPKVASRG